MPNEEDACGFAHVCELCADSGPPCKVALIRLSCRAKSRHLVLFGLQHEIPRLRFAPLGMTKSGSRSAAGPGAGREASLEQITAGGRFPIDHLASDKDAG